MNKEEQSLYDELVSKHKYIILKNFLEKNKDDILKALNDKVEYKTIYNKFVEMTNLDVKYRWFCQILSEFKKKYIYNLSEAEYKKQMQTISQPATATPEKKVEIEQPEILAAKISEVEQRPQPAQPKEQEKVETKKDVPADANPSGKIPKWKQEGFSSSYEYFNYMKSRPSSEKITQSETNTEYNNGYKWEPSIKK